MPVRHLLQRALPGELGLPFHKFEFLRVLFHAPPTPPEAQAARSDLLAGLSLPRDQQDPRFLRSLTPSQIAQLEEPFTVDEIKDSIARQRNGASPGISGVPHEFYKAFSKTLAPHLTDVYNSSWDDGRLPKSLTTSLIRQAFKEGKPGADPSNLTFQRPLSLVEAARNIESSAVVFRLKSILPTIIPLTQYGFIPSRHSSDAALHLHLLLDLFSRTPDAEGVLLSLDQEKAYDMISHDWIDFVFAAIGAGPRFRRLIKTLATSGTNTARVIVNGFLTDLIQLLRGVGQGDSLSPPIYSVVFQPFIDALTRRHIASLLLKTPTFFTPADILTAVAFADDTILAITDPLAPARLATLAIDWKLASGGQVVVAKSYQLALNLPPNHPLRLPDVKIWEQIDVFKWCGYHFSATGDTAPAFEARLKRLKRSMNYTSLFRPSLPSRVQYANSYITGSIRHVLTAIPPPREFLERLDSAISNFVWGPGRRHAIDAATTYLPRSLGGLGLISVRRLDTRLRLEFMQSFLQPDDPPPIWLALAHDAVRHHSARSLPPIALLAFPIPISKPPELLIYASLRALQKSPPSLLPTLSQAELIGLPPTFPGLLDIPPSLKHHLQPIESIGELLRRGNDFFVLSDQKRRTKGPQAARDALAQSTLADPDLAHLAPFLEHHAYPSPLPLRPIDPPTHLSSFNFTIQPIPDDPDALLLATSTIVPDPPPPLPPDFWQSIWQGPTPARAARTVYLAAHGRTSTQRLIHKIDPAVSTDCLACGVRDSVAHRFFDCPLAQEAWALLHSFIHETTMLFIPLPSYTPYHILLGFSRDVTDKVTLRKLRAIRAILMDELEATRFYQRSHPTFIPTASSVVLKVRRRLAQSS